MPTPGTFLEDQEQTTVRLTDQQFSDIFGAQFDFDPDLVLSPDELPSRKQGESLVGLFENNILSQSAAEFPSNIDCLAKPEHRPGLWPEAEFTFTAPLTVPFGSNLEIGNKPNIWNAQAVEELAAIGKSYQAYVSDEADEADCSHEAHEAEQVDKADKDHGFEMPTPASSHTAGADINESSSEDRTDHNGSKTELVASQEVEHKANVQRRFEDVMSFEKLMRTYVAQGHIAAQEYHDPKNRQLFQDVYVEAIEDLIAEGYFDQTTPGSPCVRKHNDKPKGIYHRLNYSSTSVQKRLITVTGKGKTARLTSSRRRRTRYYYLLNVARKRTVSFKCYALCSLARNLLGKKTTLQRHLQKTTKILFAQDSSAPQGLQKAWDTASVA